MSFEEVRERVVTMLGRLAWQYRATALLGWIAAVLTVLLAYPGRVAFDDLVARIEGLDAERVFPQMKAIPGVVFLQSPPPGLSLTPDLRAQLRGG
jgi:hypothetical protein